MPAMGARGPIPKPTAMKEAAGNPGKRVLSKGEPAPPPGDPEAPAWLSEAGRAQWTAIAPVLVAMRTLTVADTGVFARYCEMLVRWIECSRLVREIGTTYAVRDAPTKKGEPGQVRYWAEFPHTSEWRKLAEALLRLEAHLGLTPAARSRINVTPVGVPAPAGPAVSDEQAERDRRRREFFSAGAAALVTQRPPGSRRPPSSPAAAG